MKKILLPIIVTGLFSTSALALSPATETSNVDWTQVFSEIQESAATVPDSAEKNPDDKSKKGLKRTIFKRVMQYKTAKFVFRNPGKTLIAGATVGGLGYYGYYKMSKELFKQKMARYELFEQEWQNMIDYYPDEWEALLKRVEYDIAHSDDEEHVENLEKFLDFVAVSAKAKKLAEEVMEALGQNGTHNFIMNDVEKIFKEAEEEFNKTGKKCTVNDLKKLLDRNEDFDGYSQKLIKNNSGEFSVSSYGILKQNNFKIGQFDHIPSYKAIETFLIINGINVPLKTEKENKDIGVTKTMINKVLNSTKNNIYKIAATKRNTLLEENTTAIAVKQILHKASRTYAGRNQNKQYISDAYDLKNATILDIGFELYYLKQNGFVLEYQQYLESSKVLIKRNFELCLYQ